MSPAIKDVDIEYADEAGSQIRAIRIVFGDGHTLELADQDGQALLSLHNNGSVVRLDASEPVCDFERAANLLALYMPGCVADLED